MGVLKGKTTTIIVGVLWSIPFRNEHQSYPFKQSCPMLINGHPNRKVLTVLKLNDARRFLFLSSGCQNAPPGIPR